MHDYYKAVKQQGSKKRRLAELPPTGWLLALLGDSQGFHIMWKEDGHVCIQGPKRDIIHQHIELLDTLPNNIVLFMIVYEDGIMITDVFTGQEVTYAVESPIVKEREGRAIEVTEFLGNPFYPIKYYDDFNFLKARADEWGLKIIAIKNDTHENRAWGLVYEGEKDE